MRVPSAPRGTPVESGGLRRTARWMTVTTLVTVRSTARPHKRHSRPREGRGYLGYKGYVAANKEETAGISSPGRCAYRERRTEAHRGEETATPSDEYEERGKAALETQ
ncbi:hypothetical protein NDU88_003598 [Pleurodeles waltl]|uniref:Uncharacterized protein n=1 Tax=Pleurodeles waltl TaxID=8319 RepID=A0AAV7T5S1_PLEWA|nr:hypothetical protein NDU88_003598 [Pleurodeles waltl]